MFQTGLSNMHTVYLMVTYELQGRGYEKIVHAFNVWRYWGKKRSRERMGTPQGDYDNLSILELTMWLAVWPCMCGNRPLERLLSPSPKSQVMFESAFSWIDDFAVFLAFIRFTLRPLFTRRGHNMHLHAHKLCGARELSTHTEPCDWSAGAHGVTTMLGVSLRARRHTTQVMLGLSLRARWDTTLLFVIEDHNGTSWRVAVHGEMTVLVIRSHILPSSKRSEKRVNCCTHA